MLTVHKVRDFTYRGDRDFTARWETCAYDLNTLVGFDMFVSFWGPTLYGHTTASLEFAYGRHLAASIERRKEVGEEYSALRGFFRQYELYHVVADERDVVEVRANQRGDTLDLSRIGGSPNEGCDLLLDYVREINSIAERPRCCNALTPDCSTTVPGTTRRPSARAVRSTGGCRRAATSSTLATSTAPSTPARRSTR